MSTWQLISSPNPLAEEWDIWEIRRQEEKIMKKPMLVVRNGSDGNWKVGGTADNGEFVFKMTMSNNSPTSSWQTVRNYPLSQKRVIRWVLISLVTLFVNVCLSVFLFLSPRLAWWQIWVNKIVTALENFRKSEGKKSISRKNVSVFAAHYFKVVK